MSDPDGLLGRLRDRLPVPAFHPSAIPVVVDADTLHVRSGPWNGIIYTVRDGDEEGVLGRLGELIDGETPIEEILEAFEPALREEIGQVIDQLHDNGVVYDASELSDPAYRHLVLDSRYNTWEQRPIDSQSVLVVNAGRIGPWVATDLRAMGVEDVGFVEPVESARTARDSTDDDVTVFEPDELGEAVEAADFVVYTADRLYPLVLDELNELTHETSTPWVPAQTLGVDGVVGPAVFPGETACYDCFRRRVSANVNNPAGLKQYRDALAADETLRTESSPALARLVAGLVGLDLLNLLAYGVGYTAETVVTCNGVDMTVESNRVLKLPRCDVCGIDPASQANPFLGFDDVMAAARNEGGSTE